MVLACIGFVILVIVIRSNYNPGQDQKVYDIDGMYIPVTRQDLTNTQALYQQLIGSRAVQCPVTELPKPNGTVVPVTSIWSSYYNHPYSVTHLFLTSSAIQKDSGATPHADNWRTVLNLSDASASTGSQRVSTLFTTNLFTDNDYVEIVAPFAFYFDNVNTSASEIEESGGYNEKIVIVNRSGNVRITFDYVANWFCAGPVGTVTVAGTGSDGNKAWEDHYSAHHTVIGNSGNASVKGGIAGELIGYADANTLMTIEVYNGSRWVGCSLQDLILPSK